MANCSSGLLGVIIRKTFHFIPVVPLLAFQIQEDLSKIAWSNQHGSRRGIAWDELSKDWLPLTAHQPETTIQKSLLASKHF